MSKIKEWFLLEIAFPVADFFMGTKAMYWYRRINNMQSWSCDEINAWQFARLKLLLNHAYAHTVFYREVFDDFGILPDDIKSFEDLGKLPVLTKDIITKRFDDFVSDNIHKIKHRYASTGGSTGEPFRYIIDENTWGFVTAIKIFSWKKTSYRYGDRYLSLGSSSLFPVTKKSVIHEIYFRIRNTIPLNGMNMDDEVCERYINLIKKYNVEYLYGYASAIYLLASYSKKKSYGIQIKSVFTTAEKLTEEYRSVIESAWNTRVMDCYGARDGGITAYEINQGYYNVGYNTFCEAEEEKPSQLLCTNLIDYAFPLIRYKVGDEVILFTDKEQCNYNGQVFSEIIGRTSDILQLDNGHQLTTSGFNSMFRDFNIKAFRISKQDGMSLKIEIQKGNSYSVTEESLIIQTMKKHAGDNVDINIVYVDNFQPLKNGKRSFFMNEID